MTDKIPFALPDITQVEIDEVVDTMQSGWLTTGPKAKLFEEEFAKRVGSKHAVAVNSATSGMHLALEAIGIKRDDKVLTSINTFTATAEVIRYFGAHPVFTDIDPVTMNIDPVEIERTLAKQPGIKAIMPVHIAGQACDMDPIQEIAHNHGLPIVEDAAHAFPTTYKGKMIGSIGEISAFSFYVTKTLATGEGGMVTTNHEGYAERMRVMRLHGFSRDAFNRYRSDKPAWQYEIVAPGFKYNLPDILASIGIHQLARSDEMMNKRRKIAEKYNAAFEGLPISTPTVVRPDDMHSWHLYIIKVDQTRLNISRNDFIKALSDEGVSTSVHFIPLHMHPYWRDTYDLKNEQFPKATAMFDEIVSLPVYSKLTEQETDRIIDVVTKVCKAHEK